MNKIILILSFIILFSCVKKHDEVVVVEAENGVGALKNLRING